MVSPARALVALLLAVPFLVIGCGMIVAPQRAHDLFHGSNYESETLSPKGRRNFQLRGAAVAVAGGLVGVVVLAGSA